MNIKEIGEMTITLTNSEIWDIGFCIRHDVEHTAKTHWINHYEGNSKEGFADYVKDKEKVKVGYMKFFFGMAMRLDVVEGDLTYNLKEIFKPKED
jgi:hypothetical protein